MRHTPRLTGLLLLALVAACAGSANREPSVRPREATVQVENQAWLDVTVYVLDGGRRMRLGNAGASRTTSFRLPDVVVGPGRVLRFEADPIGSSRVATSFEIQVSPGQTVHLTIPPSVGH